MSLLRSPAGEAPGFAGRVFDFAMSRPELMRLLAWSTLEPSVQALRSRTASHDAKVAALAAAQDGHRQGAEFSPAFLVTTVMSVASSWSAASPFGPALRPGQAELRDQVVRAVGRLTSA